MFKFTMTYKGKPFDAKEYGNDLKKLVIKHAIDQYQERLNTTLSASLSADEMKQVIIEITEADNGNPLFNIRAPEELRDKINKAFTP